MRRLAAIFVVFAGSLAILIWNASAPGRPRTPPKPSEISPQTIIVRATSIGAQAQQPLARVVVGGMVTTVFAILFVMPLLVRRFTSKQDLARELRNTNPEEI